MQRLQRLGLARMEVDLTDRRRRSVLLTEEGRQAAEQFQSYLIGLEGAFTDLFDQLGTDLHRAAVDAHRALANESLAQRMASHALTEEAP